MQQVTDDKILSEYEKEGEKIISKMLNVLMRAQRKADDLKYRRTLEALEKKQ